MGNYNPDTNMFRLQTVTSTLLPGNSAIAFMTVRAATNIPASSTITLSGFRVRHTSGEYEDITAANAAVTGQAAPSASIALACSPSILRKVDGSYKGVVIRNGKKVVIK